MSRELQEGRARRSRGVGVACVLCAVGCSTGPATPAKTPTSIFGGQGAVIAEETPLGGDAVGDAVSPQGGPCARPARAADFALLDDFEDGDYHLFKGFERDGYWFARADATEGATLSPPAAMFAAERLPAGEASPANLFAAHLQAAGQRDWGAVWGTTLQWESKGIRCPLNASAFAGVRFRAKGPGVVRVNFPMPETQAAENGGTCTSGCYDYHGKKVFLTDRWADYFVPWNRVQQVGYGVAVRFDAARIIGLNFLAGTKDLPIDLWVDDIAFVTPREAGAIAEAERKPTAVIAAAGR